MDDDVTDGRPSLVMQEDGEEEKNPKKSGPSPPFSPDKLVLLYCCQTRSFIIYSFLFRTMRFALP